MSGWIGSRARGILVMFGDFDFCCIISQARRLQNQLGVGCHVAVLVCTSDSLVYLGSIMNNVSPLV